MLAQASAERRSKRINRPGRNSRSNSRAMTMVIAVIMPIDAFTSKLDWARIRKPAARATVVTSRPRQL